MNADASDQAQRKQRSLILVGVLSIVMAFVWLQWRALASTNDTYETALAQLDQMRADVLRIQSLRQVPQAAAGRPRRNEELLAQVERALEAAGIDHAHWHDSIPQPPVRLPKSDYKRLTTRLYFEDVTLWQLAAFAHHLEAADPTLAVSAVNITNRRLEGSDYDVDLAVSYLVYNPRVPG